MPTLQEAWVWSLVRELRSHMPCSMAKKEKKISKFQLPDKREEAREGESWRFMEHENCKFQSRSSSESKERNMKEGCQAYVCPCTKRGLWIFSFPGLCHSGCGHPPVNDGVVDAFKTSFQLWLLPSRVELGGMGCAGSSLCLWKAKGCWGCGETGLLAMRKCGKSLACVLNCCPTFLPQHYITPSLSTYQSGLKTVHMMMVPVQFPSGKLKVPTLTTLRKQEHQSSALGKSTKETDLNWVPSG